MLKNHEVLVGSYEIFLILILECLFLESMGNRTWFLKRTKG